MIRYFLIISLYVLISLLTSCNSPVSKSKNFAFNFQNNDSNSEDSLIQYDFNKDTPDTLFYINANRLNDEDLLKFNINIKSKGNYNDIKNQIVNARDEFKSVFDTANSDSIEKVLLDTAGKYLNEIIVNSIIPHWYGTLWDFNGYTNTPKEGEIACGYFVSTTLKHAGFNLNRYRLAQLFSADIVKTLQLNDSVINFGCNSPECIIDSINENLPSGLYVVGLDCHVGFLLKRNGEVFFIHSNYLEPNEVIIEFASESEAFRSSTIYPMGEITTNRALIKKWINFEILKE